MLRNSSLTEQWELAVSSCLAVLCLRIDGQPTGFTAQQMVTEYLAVEHNPALVMFNTHLGLTVLDLLPDGDDPAPVIDRLMSTATGVGGANGARESLAHPRFLNGLPGGQAAELMEIVKSSTLGQSVLSPESRTRLLASVEISEVAAMRQLEIARLGAMQTP
ncbi:hypothetical protein [Acrocarpospora sp. B8E8]|uniref:hypothetical protein n=1 Tax=Acrocarpospora sp. B8E8 TaxID=3153572 RepID=UPI00325FAC36